MSEHHYIKVRWRSGDALDCKSNQPGSTPGRTSTPPNATLPSSQHRPASAAFIPAKWCTIVILRDRHEINGRLQEDTGPSAPWRTPGHPLSLGRADLGKAVDGPPAMGQGNGTPAASAVVTLRWTLIAIQRAGI